MLIRNWRCSAGVQLLLNRLFVGGASILRTQSGRAEFVLLTADEGKLGGGSAGAFEAAAGTAEAGITGSVGFARLLFGTRPEEEGPGVLPA